MADKLSPRKKATGTVVGMRKLLKHPKPPTKFSPSMYLTERSLMTTERLSRTKEMYPPEIIEFLDITENGTFKDSSVDPDQALFQPFPSEVVFQRYEKKKTYEFPLSLRNLDRVARHVKITQEKSPYFSVISSKSGGQKVAPGMEIVYTIVFTPDDEKDYGHELICVTERERFRVPIRAIGPRALLDFPDEIHFTSAPVKYLSTKSVLVRNIGNKESKVELRTTRPFTVSPSTFTLKPKVSLQVEVGFNSALIGDHVQELEIEYDTGDLVYVQLHGSAVNVNVRMDKSSLLMEDTYIGLFSQRVVTLSNRSDIPVHFEWKAMMTEEEELYQRDLYNEQLSEEEATSRDTFMERCLHNPSVRDRFPILSHSYKNRKKLVSNEKFLFSDLTFFIDPIEGDIWPSSQAEVTVTFQPNKATNYSAVAFCDVTGRENRLPLKVKGTGKGPQLKFSFDTLDIQNIFVNSAHAYEVVLENTGDIEAIYSLQPSSSLFGPKFTFNPSSGHLLPDCLQVIQISFGSSSLGKFEEDFVWEVDGSPEQLHLKIMGSVIGPTFQFSVPEINFGTISYGFPVTREVILTNLSEVVMTYSLKVPLDERRSISSNRGGNQEFLLSPQADALPPGIPQAIKVTFTPKLVKDYTTYLVMDIGEVGKDVYSLPIKASSIVPSVSISPSSLQYGRCFLNYPYTTNLILHNSHSLPAHYEMMKMTEDSTIICTTTVPKGVINGQERLSIPLTIQPQDKGSLSVTCMFCILGSTSPPLQVEVTCIGEGPVVSVTPAQLDWGGCPVLTPVPKGLVLRNESEIEATFETVFMRDNGVFNVEPWTGIIPPRETMELTITAELDDCVCFNDKLTIHVDRSVSHTVCLTAEGKGTTIVSTPPLCPSVHLGTHFSCHQCTQEFVLTNRGRRTQALSWTTEGFSLAKLKKAEKERASRDKKDVANKSLKQSDAVPFKKPMFRIIPDRCIIPPMETQTVVITGYSDVPQSVTEKLICHSVIGRNPHKEKIMGIDVTGHFITPLLQFSTKEIKFATEQLPGSELVKHYQDVLISRVSPLPLTVSMCCSYPFSLMFGTDKKQHFSLDLALSFDEEVAITVVFDSTYCKDRHSRIEDQNIEIAYLEHPQKDFISLRAEVYFPNLDFEMDKVDFGCQLNDTEQVQTLRMTNTSPLEVQYNWSFLKRPPIRRTDPFHDDEGVDMQSDACETDSLEETRTSSGSSTDDNPAPPEPIDGVTVTITPPSPDKVDRELMPNKVSVEEVLAQSLPPSENGTETTPSVDSEDEAEEGGRRKDPWELVDDPFVPIGIEQVFDILPLFGVLQPGEAQDVQVTFYGHADIATEVMAMCKVHGGPSYQLVLAGEASTIQYKIDNRKIQLYNVPYDSVCEEDITLTNIGKVSLDFHVLDSEENIGRNELFPGRPSVQPTMGTIDALETQKLNIRFFPGTARSFKRSFKIQVAHFEPDTITLVGDGYYPRISLSLPRPIVQNPSPELEEIKTSFVGGKRNKKKKISPVELEWEAERIVIDSFVEDRDLKFINNVKSTRARPTFPEYLLDFGCVVSGLTVSRRIVLTNIAPSALSLTTPQSSLTNTGFSVTLDPKIKDLPPGEIIDFTVQFDPASVNSSLGYTEAMLPIQLVGGPIYPLKLSANVTLPMMEVSSSSLDFSTVLCGQCKIITVRLYNTRQVKCHWNAITEKPPKKIPKHTPLHVRKKMKEKPPPHYFEVDPPNGILLSGQKTDIQIKFMPSDEVVYKDEIPLVIYQNPDARLVLSVTGKGSEPQIMFDRNMIQFTPVFPFSDGSDVEVTIQNPLNYPVEIYSLEFDQQYQEEENMLQWVKGYDIKNRLFLPPTEVGQQLPKEIIEAYNKRYNPLLPDDGSSQIAESKSVPDDDQMSSTSLEQTISQGVVESASVHPHLAELQARLPSSTALLPQMIGVSSTSVLSHGTLKGNFSDPSLEGLELTPVANCIARYLGIDLSPEAALAETRKGVAIILNGAHLSGKTTQARCLSEIYSALVLNVEDLIMDVISTGSTPAGIKARELCIEATVATQKETAPVVESADSPLSSKVSMAGSRKPTRGTINTVSGAKNTATKETTATTEDEPKKETPEPFTVDPLYNTPHAAPSNQLIPAKLPEELVVEILADRLQNTDCRKGVIFDGLKCRFAADSLMTTALILRALGDRKHIFFVNLELDLDGIKDRIAAIESDKEKKKEEEQRLKLEEEERIQALLDMSEDEYEGLSSTRQREIDTIRQQRYLEKKRKRQLEKEEKERKEQARREEEQRLLEEEKGKGKKRGALNKVQDQSKNLGGGSSRPESAASTQLRQASLVNPSAVSMGNTESTNAGRKRSGQAEKKEDKIQMNFLAYNLMSESIQSMLEDWDRVKGVVRPKKQAIPQETLEQRKVSATPKKKARKSQNRNDISPRHSVSNPLQQNIAATTSTLDQEIEEESREGLGVPFISLPTTPPIEEVTRAVCDNYGFPTPTEILHSLGIYLLEPPIPDPVLFQVYPYPLKRRPVLETKRKFFTFISTGPNDPNIEQEVKITPEPVIPEEPELKLSPEPPTSSRHKHSGSNKSKDDQRKKSIAKLTSKQGKTSPSPQHQEETPLIEEQPSEQLMDLTPKKLVKFRWIIPPHGECKIRLLFSSDEEGQFDQIMNFEIMGTRRLYQLFCRGVCQYPTICRDPRIVFPNRKKTIRNDEIIHKRYIMEKERYQFGPLHCGKPRDKYREGRYPENMETINISNPTPMTSEITFCFRHDINATTFLYEPPKMTLAPGESQPLNVWAYPKAAGEFKDAIVCSIKGNPYPTVFPVSAIGVEPELKLDRKHLDFGKVLLHRRESRVLHLRNNTLLPVAWKLNGLEMLGDEFSFGQEQGIVQPKTEFPLNINFRAAKPVSYSKKAFKIEVSDVEQIIGLINVEHVQLQAEAYDVALDISFPKGADGGLEFGILRVFEEQKQTMLLKNRGKYEIGYNFIFDLGPNGLDYSKWFVLNPTSSVLYAGEKSQSVNITFKPDKEFSVKDEPILKCQVIDTHLGEHGEVIANIPIRFTAKSVFTKYSVSPLSDVNFGCMVITNRRTSSFTIENNGDFEFRYCVSKRLSPELQKIRQNLPSQQAQTRLKRDISVASRSSSVVGKTTSLGNKHKDPSSLRYEVLGGSNQRLIMGVFSIAPSYGVVGPGQSQTINVECVAERAGKHEELLSLEMSDANRKMMPMKYKVCAEVLVPGINTTDLSAIFEEHRVCKELGVLGQHQFHEEGCVGIFGETEKRFLFKSVIIGQSSKARFRIINSNKIPCDVNIVIIRSGGPAKSKSAPEIFEVDSSKASIGPHSHVYATVTFKPVAMQVYNAQFEVAIDGPSHARGKGLTFDLQGEGILPQVAVTKPKTFNGEHGHQVLLFRKLLLGEKQVLPVVLSNAGTIGATVIVDMEIEQANEEQYEEVFRVSYQTVDSDGDECFHSSLPLSFEIPIDGKQELLVSFRPQSTRVYERKLVIRVQDNQFETMSVSLTGEGYQDDVVVQNIRGPIGSQCTGTTDLVEGDLESIRGNMLQFGGCPISEARSLTFTLANYSDSNIIRFKWPSVAGILTFTPSLGHIYPGSSKDITATLMSTKPKVCKHQKFAGKYWEIKYTSPTEHHSEWDDRVRTVKWINVPHNKRSDETTGKELPAKKKVIDIETEPAHEIICTEGGIDIDMQYSAIISTAEYECPTKAISFKDTYVLQTKTFKLPIKNVGLIDLSYQWFLIDSNAILEDSSRSSMSTARSETEGIRSETDPSTEREECVNVSIEPQQGEIAPGGEQIVTFKFSPFELVEFTHWFRCQISSLSPSVAPLDICVSGSSVLPYCHFDIPESDYLTNRRPSNAKGVMLLNSGSTGSIEPSTKVIEFTSTGTGHKITRSFFITNPTKMSFEFQWSCQDAPSSFLSSPIFTCLTPKGQVTGGKKYQITFEYLSTNQLLTESLWQFSIPSLSLSIPFLLVGHTFEPRVNIDRAYLNFRSMLIGTTVREKIYLVNDEEQSYKFKFNDRTCQCENPKARLIVSPIAGTIQPKKKLPIEVSFSAPEPREFIFHLQCNVKRKSTPINLNIKALGHSIDVGVSATNEKGDELMLLPRDGGTLRIIDFGKVTVNERALWQLSVFNYCGFELQYQLVLSDGCNKQGGVEEKQITLFPLEGNIKPKDKSLSELRFSPRLANTLKNCEILVKITNGPSIPIILKGSGVEPKASFSFLEYDFGPRLLVQHNMSDSTMLRITNNDKKDLNINCDNCKNNGVIELLNFEPGLLPSGESIDIDVVFRPGKAVQYKETFEFEINGVCKKKVTVKGEGALMKVETVNPAHRHVNLGAIGINERSCKRIRLVNRSLLAVTFAVAIVPTTQLPVLHQESVLGVALCPKKGGPLREVTLKPREEIDMEVTFNPPLRIPQFSEEVIMEAYGQSQPLFIVKGSCHGVEISLDSNHVPFGAVVKSSQSTRRVLLMNTGDVGARFKWDIEKFSPDFSIHPSDGYILSGMEVPFTITFHPKKLSQDIRYDNLTCNIEGSRPLKLTLTGMCIDQTPMKEVLHFTTTVRCKETRQITVHNKTAVPWVLCPIINGIHWTGPVSFAVPTGGASHYELTYHPLVMTQDSQKHSGSIFFPLPDGTGLLQNLLGTSDPPKNSGSIAKEIPCKTPHTELLIVDNWLRQPQRFRAFVENVRPEKLDHSVNLYGNDYIDVPALGKKEYQLHFYSFKEGSYLSKVTFQNETTGEYQFFHVHFKSIAPGIISTVELVTAVRQGVSHTITIDNPFQTPVNMTTNVNCADVTLPSSFLIGGESQGKCTFEYLPLKVGETSAKLILQSHELGAYNYELVLKATPPPPERTVHFTTALGGNQVLPCHFSNYARGRVEYICKVDHPDFHVERSLTVAATEASVDVTYEPSSLGDSQVTLTISSSSGGDYLIPIQGHCLAPRPQGPFNIKAGGGISIPFKNVFHQARQFSFSVDNPAFAVKTGDTLKPRKVYNIFVQFDKDKIEKSKQAIPVKLAKLVVTSVQSANRQNRTEEGLQWTYYIKGLPP